MDIYIYISNLYICILNMHVSTFYISICFLFCISIYLHSSILWLYYDPQSASLISILGIYTSRIYSDYRCLTINIRVYICTHIYSHMYYSRSLLFWSPLYASTTYIKAHGYEYIHVCIPMYISAFQTFLCLYFLYVYILLSYEVATISRLPKNICF